MRKDKVANCHRGIFCDSHTKTDTKYIPLFILTPLMKETVLPHSVKAALDRDVH